MTLVSTRTCRCGHDPASGDPHPCHANAYTCRKPAQRRLYSTGAAPLAGVNVKFLANDTWACDDCWAGFQRLLKDRS